MIDNEPLISVVTVSYNAVSTIEETILSVINQTYKNIEYIVIDGGSTDGTVDIIRKYADKITYWVSEPDKGIYDAMNKGIAVATGEYCSFMNSGDTYYLPNTIQSVFKDTTDSDVVYGDNVLKYNWGCIVLAPDTLENMNKYMVFGHQTTFTKKALLKKFGYDCSFKISADYHFFYTLYKKGYKFEYKSMPISLFEASSGVSNNSPLITFKEDAIITGRIESRFWEINFILYKLKLFFSRCLKRMLFQSFVKKIERKRISKNKLIKEIF